MKVWLISLSVANLSIFCMGKGADVFNSKVSNGRSLLEAGCKYSTCEDLCDVPNWKGYGYLLQNGACIEPTYSKSIVPENGFTFIYATITDQILRDVDSKKQKVTLDFTIIRRWIDPGIKTNFSDEDIKNGGIDLDIEERDNLWHPDLYVYNISDYKAAMDSIQIKNYFLLPLRSSALSNNIELRGKQENQTVVQYTIEAKAKIYCDFDLNRYPMDNQLCKFRLGTRTWGAKIKLFDKFKAYHDTKNYKAENFEVQISFIDEGIIDGRSKIGFDIRMQRILGPYIMEYYLPSLASVLVSQIGFLIPLSSIPGRAALLVTQFLSLINIFIAERVSSAC